MANIKKDSLFSLLYIFILIIFSSLDYTFAEISDSIEITNPIFTIKGVDETPYEIKAEKGVQEGDFLNLYMIEGKLKNKDNVWVYLNADEGNFNQNDGMVSLFKNIIVYTDKNEKIYSDFALVDTKQKIITLDKNVKYESDMGTITADHSVIKNDFSNIIYSGNVNSIIKIDLK